MRRWDTDSQALLGFERNLTTLDGRVIPLARGGTTQPGEVEVIEGEGVSCQNTTDTG
jgi:DnaJ-related protein SCJ1